MRQAAISISLLALLAGCMSARAAEYDGPRPPKADVPYLLHASTLVETEASEARQEDRQKETAYVVAGASSPVRTPLAEPIFILLSESLKPEQFQLFDVQVVKGNRETVFPKDRKKRPPRPRYLTMRKLDENLFWLEVNEWLDNGQYCLTPQGANTVFCFEVY
jgi:hypothetical protein